MKKDNELITLAAIIILVPVVVCARISAGIGIINLGINGVNKIRQMKYYNKIKKGLKEGSIVEIDGEYYKVQEAKNIEEAE